MTHHSRIEVLKGKLLAAAMGALLSICAPAHATLIGYQSKATFDAAISGWTSTSTNFESVPVGTMYNTGTGPVGSGFTLSLTGPDAPALRPTVANQFWTTSGTHYLGLNNPDTAFEAGDTLTFTLGTAVQAFGLFIIGNRDVLGGDMRLSAGTSSVVNGAIANLTDGSGSFAYFLGLVSDDAGTFNSVRLDYSTLQPGDLLPIAVDDVALALNDRAHPVPEPGTFAFTLMGLLLLGVLARRRIR